MSVRAAARASLAALVAIAYAGCSGPGARADVVLPAATTQLVLVTTPDWDATGGTLRTYARERGAWRPVSHEVPVSVGRNGTAWGIGLHPPQEGPQKREGDGRAPAGVFRIGTSFGYAATSATRMPYAAMDRDDWCIDVPASPLYNRIVDAKDVGTGAIAGSTEPMRRDLHADGDVRYALGFVVEHNPRAVRDAGSCIFAHLWQSPGQPTAGCTAMAEPDLRAVLAWLDPSAEPLFVLLPRDEHARVRRAWGLP